MLFRCISMSFFAFLLCFAGAAYADPIGTIVEIEGTVTVTPAGGTAHAAKIKDEISMNDTVATAAGSRAFILLVDDTEWTLSENTKFKVDQYVFNPDDSNDNKARYSVLEGAFRYVSGLVAKKPTPDVSISTPVGAIGIRGTDFSAGPDAGGEYAVYVDEGAVNVRTLGGEALLNHGEGSTIRSRRDAPGRPARWDAKRMEHLRGALFLKNKAAITERRAALRTRQTELRNKMRDNFRQRREQRDQNGLQQKREQQREQMRDKWQQRLQDRKDNRGNGTTGDAIDRAKDRQQQLQQQLQQRRLRRQQE